MQPKEILNLEGECGFLDPLHVKNIQKIKTTYNEYFILAEDINKLIYDIYYNIDIKNNDIIGLFLISSFSKTHRSFQSAILLYSYGLEEDVHILFRIMLESLFICTAVYNDKTNYTNVKNNFEIEQYKLKKLLIEEGIIKEDLPPKIQKQKTGIKEFAKRANLSNMYKSYLYSSSYIHLDIHNLESKFDKIKNIIYTLDISPSYEKIQVILCELATAMLSFVNIIKCYLTKDYSEDINTLEKRHFELSNISEV